MTNTKQHTFDDYKNAEYGKGLDGQIATQLMRMYKASREIATPTILELGTAEGASTALFLQACEERDGQLVSVDLKDCSGVSESPRWQFVQSDSTDIAYILSQAPRLESGIDILYLDSLHTKAHVEKELTGWYPLLNEGAHIFFDDVDANPYRTGNRKDNFNIETELDAINEYIRAFFHANEDDLYLDIMYGTTGLAHLYKLCPKGTVPSRAKAMVVRRRNAAGMLRYGPRRLASSVKSKLVGGSSDDKAVGSM